MLAQIIGAITNIAGASTMIQEARSEKQEVRSPEYCEVKIYFHYF
jgi:hypothetical protein